jgi:hypothetical protein
MVKKRSVERKIYVGLAVVLGIAVVLGGGLFFIFGEDTPEVLGFDKLGIGGDEQDDLRSDENADLDSSGNVSGESEENVSIVGSGSDRFICSEWSQVQYSLGNFFEEIECLVYGVEGCESVRATCGSEVFNLDYETGGAFRIRHSVFSGDQEIEFEIVEENVGARGRATLRAEVEMEGVFDVGSLRCIVDSDSIPHKCIG